MAEISTVDRFYKRYFRRARCINNAIIVAVAATTYLRHETKNEKIEKYGQYSKKMIAYDRNYIYIYI